MVLRCRARCYTQVPSHCHRQRGSSAAASIGAPIETGGKGSRNGRERGTKSKLKFSLLSNTVTGPNRGVVAGRPILRTEGPGSSFGSSLSPSLRFADETRGERASIVRRPMCQFTQNCDSLDQVEVRRVVGQVTGFSCLGRPRGSEGGLRFRGTIPVSLRASICVVMQ